MSAAPDTDQVYMLTAARWYAGRGIPVFPLWWPTEVEGQLVCACPTIGCERAAKHPITQHGLNDATTDLDQVDAWWRKYPHANIGLRTGVVFDLLDIDGPEGFANLEKMVAELGGYPHAMSVTESGRASGGRHYYMQPAGRKALSGGKAGVPKGIDVKGEGGYVVAAPSRHISGNRYTLTVREPSGTVDWNDVYTYLTSRELAPSPTPPKPRDPFADDPFKASSGSFGQAVLDRILGEMRSAVEGHRWDTFAKDCAFDLGRAIAGGTLDRASSEAALAQAARDVGLSDGEVDRLGELVDNAIRKTTQPIAPKQKDAPATKTWTEEESQGEAWPQPDSLSLPVPDFPTHVLGWMQPAVEALADELQTPVDIVGMLFLATIAATVRGRADVTISGRWTEPLNIYVAVVAGAGETKSPALAVISRPLRDLEARLIASAAVEVSRNEQDRRIQKSRVDKLERTSVTAKDPFDRENARADAEAELERLHTMPELHPPRLLAADTTPEGLVQLLGQQRGVMAVLSAEGGLFDTLAGGRYSSGMANLDAVLQAHDGREPILVDRKGSPPIRVDRPCLTLGMAVQPQVLEAVGKSEAAVGRGFLARFLYSVPATRVGSRRVSRPINERGSEDFEYVVERINEALGGDSEDCEYVSLKVNLKFSSSSSEIFYSYRESLEPRRHPRTGDLAALAGWANKLDGQIARLAGLLQLIYNAEHPQNPQNPTEVGDDALIGALDLAEYLIGHATAAHLLMRGQALATSNHALQVLGWIQRSNTADFTVRDAHQALRGRVDFQHPETVSAACQALAAAGHLRPIETPREPGTPGRSASPRYLVNPYVFEETA